MIPEENGTDEGIPEHVVRKTERIKEEILDESFKIAESSKDIIKKQVAEKKFIKKPFPKSGIIFIIIAIFALVFINNLPWMYIKYNTAQGETDLYINRGFIGETGSNETRSILGAACTNCSSDSHNYIGLSVDDFTDSPKIISYGFIAIIILGICITAFAVIDKFRNFAIETIFVVYSAIAAAEIIVGVIILSFCVKFIGAYFLLSYNMPFIEDLGLKDIGVIFLTPIILVVLSSLIVKGAASVIDINFRELDKKIESEKPQKSFSTYLRGSNI